MTFEVTVEDSTTFYRPVLELYKDGGEHRNAEIVEEIRNILPDDEKESEKVRAWVQFAIQHFRDAGCLKRIKWGLHYITEDGKKLLELDIDSLDRKVLKEYCPRYREKYSQSGETGNDEELDSNQNESDSEITFEEALDIVKNVLRKTGSVVNGNYDMLLVKKLPDPDIIIANKSDESNGNTTHIALTNEKMDIFPFLESFDYFYNENGAYDTNSKVRFLLEVPVNLYSTNLRYLDIYDDWNELTSDKIETTVTVVRNRKNDNNWSLDKLKRQLNNIDNDNIYKMRTKLLGYEVQAELSSDKSGEEFINFRKLLFKDYFLIILKYKNEFKYDVFAVFPDDGEDLSIINYQLFALEQKTIALMPSQLWTAETDPNEIKDGGENILLYGVPGSGKSSKIKNELCKNVDEYNMERVVFHPDYTYSDFVGQILPEVSDGKVSYKFKNGPFTDILKKACDKPWDHFYLIIEEINRGNASAIFGDIFQLLDRKTEASEGHPVGTSEYSISNSEIADQIYKDKNNKIRIPSNLSIIATMNTSDQNVFTLDTAFQRRWDMRLVPNNFENHEYPNEKILDSDVKWRDFVERINKLILDKNTLITSSEDKRLGVYFVQKEELDKENTNKFAEKVLKYLWDDAFKFSRDKIFIDECDSLEELIEKFTSLSGDDRFDVFKDKEYIKHGNNGENGK